MKDFLRSLFKKIVSTKYFCKFIAFLYSAEQPNIKPIKQKKKFENGEFE